MENTYISVIGSMNYDFILRINSYPKIGETIAAYEHKFASGGKGANQAVQCSKLGIKTYMLGMVGNDYMGDFILNSLIEYGVDISYVKKLNVSSGFSVANSLPDGNVSATIVHGSNFEVNKKYIDELKSIIVNSKVVILQMEIPMETIEYAIDICYNNGVKIILNTAPAYDIDLNSLKKCDFVISNELEAQFYTDVNIVDAAAAEEAIKKLYDKIKTNCIFTLGKKGCIICKDGNIQSFKARNVKAVETTGAGDSFVGAFASSYYVFNYGIEESIHFAQTCSSITIQNIGAQNSIPTLEDVKKILNNI
ncbi:ribokinase [Brachyspira pilosicoli WesB]|uniref:Ribokinase n=1 Tax=Brachyspira pilosicoli WesB TaxID=1161918 RepID=K0JF29_BRAPL|nr:ribokinase [Brachyspira pilosicoli]CCG55733.1 ribokinase [Brachyspira pilosicoli WesB]